MTNVIMYAYYLRGCHINLLLDFVLIIFLTIKCCKQYNAVFSIFSMCSIDYIALIYMQNDHCFFLKKTC